MVLIPKAEKERKKIKADCMVIIKSSSSAKRNVLNGLIEDSVQTLEKEI